MSPMASAANAGGGGQQFDTLLLLLPLLLIAYLLFSQRRRQKKLQAMQAELQVGSRVMTTTGLFGTVAHLDASTAFIEAAPGVVLQWDRRAVVPAPDTQAAPADAPVEESLPEETPGDQAPGDQTPGDQTPGHGAPGND